MVTEIEEISVDYEEDGHLVVKQLAKEVLSKGAWTTILFRFKQWDPKKEDYGPDRFTIRRYRKLKGEYKQQSKFNISSMDQAKKIIAVLSEWVQEPPVSE